MFLLVSLLRIRSLSLVVTLQTKLCQYILVKYLLVIQLDLECTCTLCCTSDTSKIVKSFSIWPGTKYLHCFNYKRQVARFISSSTALYLQLVDHLMLPFHAVTAWGLPTLHHPVSWVMLLLPLLLCIIFSRTPSFIFLFDVLLLYTNSYIYNHLNHLTYPLMYPLHCYTCNILHSVVELEALQAISELFKWKSKNKNLPITESVQGIIMTEGHLVEMK